MLGTILLLGLAGIVVLALLRALCRLGDGLMSIVRILSIKLG